MPKEAGTDDVQGNQDPDLMHEGWKMMPLLFDTWDVDNSGTIDRNELTAGMERTIRENGLSMTMQDVYVIMEEVDLNNDKLLDRREFGCFLSRVATAANIALDGLTFSLMKQREVEAKKRLERFQKESQSLERAWIDMPRLFSLWDKDKDGYIDREEVAIGANKFLKANKITKITLAECLQLMDEVDMNGDRVLDQREFGAFMARFALATGVSLDKLTSFFMERCQEGMGKSRSLRGNAFTSFFAKVNVGMAEESLESMRCQTDKDA